MPTLLMRLVDHFEVKIRNAMHLLDLDNAHLRALLQYRFKLTAESCLFCQAIPR